MLRIRREYQSWVANESLEDYALRYAASSYRRWRPAVVASTALGGISFLALEAIGASITLSYGFQNAIAAILIVSLVIFLVSYPIAYWCSVANVDIDLLTRGAGFGYIGSTITSLIYASFTLIFFAIETAIWAQALQLATGLNLAVGYLICSLIIVPLVFFGVTFINRLQAWTQPIWIVMLVTPFVFILFEDPTVLVAWSTFPGLDGSNSGFNVLMFGAATGVLFSLIAQIGEQADYLRFLPDRTPVNRRTWWLAMWSAGPGWIVVGAMKILAGSLLAVLALRAGSSATQAVEPVHMFVHAYRSVVDDPSLALALAAAFVTISQVKINVTNAYSGSLAWSNCFVRLAHYHPGRVIWLVYNVVTALLVSLLGIFETLQAVLSVYSTVAIAWIGALVADLVVLKRVGISPDYIEFKRAHLYDVNPVGCGATLIAAATSILAYGGAFGPSAQAFYGFISLVVAFAAAIAIGYATRGRYYIARPDRHYRLAATGQSVLCCICEREYEAPDMAHCPFYRGPICSLCCGLELHCRDFCKQPDAQSAERSDIAPRMPGFQPHLLRRAGRFFGLLSATAALLGAAFLLTYRLMDLHGSATEADLIHIMQRLYAATLAVASPGVWWIVLSQERQEQSRLELLESMHYLEQTRQSLVESEKLASLGGLVAGVAHELNTPVGITVSTASFLSDRTDTVRRLADTDRLDRQRLTRYLQDAGESARLLLANARRAAQLVQNFKRLSVDRINEPCERFNLRQLLLDTVAELQPRIDEVGVEITLECDDDIIVESYPVAFAQIASNLILNALQHGFAEPAPTDSPNIAIRVRTLPIGDLVIEFVDNGHGIDKQHHGRIFEPFFTTRRMLGGSGLGLYIVNQIVTRQLDGTINIAEQNQPGTRFVLTFPRLSRNRSVLS